ncbi:MAG TPA: BadF/BadG/BcrA/BcrD ATPase family protein [Gemmatimonadales bacterium]|nr:BadF/BadG/BcrA/BcrD ATPase family protein [Gemmatimonadales bacterium]
MTQVIAGADVGGSKSAAAVWKDGTEVARVSGIGAAVRPGRALSSAATIATLVRRALTSAGLLRADLLVVGAAGAGREPEAGDLARALRNEDVAGRVQVTTDLALLLESAFPDSPGLVLAAGTGSVAVARTASGDIERAGGYGWQMGDEGGGYDMGRAVLRAIGRAADGRGRATALEQAAREVARAEDLPALIRWAASAGVAEVAALGGAAVRAAESGDAVALEILRASADELAGLALGLARSTRIKHVAVAGGLAGSDLMRNEIATRLAAGKLSVLDGVPDALEGARRLASRGQGSGVRG